MKRWRTLSLLFIVLATVPVIAGEPTIVLLSDGTAWFSKGDGSPTIAISNIIRAPGDSPNPGPGPTPPKPNPSKFREQVTQWGIEVNDTVGASLMSRAYKVLQDEIKSGRIPATADDIDEALTTIADKTIQLIPGNNDAKWRSVHEKIIGELATRLIAAGGNLSAQQYAEFFAEASAGLEDATAGKAAPPFLQKLLEVLLEILIEWISNRFGG